MASEQKFYVAGNPPSLPDAGEETKQIINYVTDELNKIAAQLQEFNLIRLQVLYAAPVRPRNGMVAYADGTTWNPGSGEGPYAYIAGSWTKLKP